MLLAMLTGFRLSELTGLRMADISVDAGAHVRVIGKGRKERCTHEEVATLCFALCRIPCVGHSTAFLIKRDAGVTALLGSHHAPTPILADNGYPISGQIN